MKRSSNLFYLEEKKKLYNKYKIRGSKKRRPFFFFLIVLLFLVFLFSYYYLINNRIVVVTADYNEVVDGFYIEGLIIRDEIVYKAPESGYYNFLVNEGSRVAYGQEIARVNSSIIHNHHAGLVSFATDGLEEVLGSDNFNEIRVSNYDDYRRKFRQNFTNNYIKKGQALFRIINNNNMYIIIKVDLEEIARYRIQEKVFIQVDELNNSLIEANIIEKKIEGNKGLLVIKLSLFLEEWLNTRRVEFNFIKNIYSGIAVPKQAIFTNTTGEGVLVYHPANGNYRFVEVQVINGNKDLVVVEGINIGDNVITNPEVLEYGRGV